MHSKITKSDFFIGVSGLQQSNLVVVTIVIPYVCSHTVVFGIHSHGNASV